MPLYDYHCSGCGNDFEELRSVSASPAAPACPACDSATDTALRISGMFCISVSAGRNRPRTAAHALAGNRVTGPGISSPKSRNSVLHNCSGSACRICG